HDAVALGAAADDAARFLALLEGDHPVHGGDDIGEDAGPFETEIATVRSAKPGGQGECARGLLLVQQLQMGKVHRGRSTRKYGDGRKSGSATSSSPAPRTSR